MWKSEIEWGFYEVLWDYATSSACCAAMCLVSSFKMPPPDLSGGQREVYAWGTVSEIFSPFAVKSRMTSLLSAIWTNYAQHVFIKQVFCIAQWFSNYAMYCLFLPDLWFQMCIQRLCRQFISSPSSHWLQTLQILKRSTALASQSLVRPEHLSGDEYGLLHICMSVAVADSWQTHGVCTVDVVFSASNCQMGQEQFLLEQDHPPYLQCCLWRVATHLSISWYSS